MTGSPNKSRLVFLGTPEFARVCLSALVECGFNVVGVVSQPDRPAGRGHKQTRSPVTEYARQNHLPLLQPENFKSAEDVAALAALQPDFLLVVAYGCILPASVLNLPTREALNVHASLLPKYRGAAPIQYALMNGDSVTGVCIMRLIAKLDAGPVFSQASMPIHSHDNTITLTEKLAQLGAKTLCTTLAELIINPNTTPIPQDESHVTYSPKIRREMSRIDWQFSALRIANQIRALLPWPVAQTFYKDKPIKIHSAQVLPSPSRGEPGLIEHLASAGITIATSDGSLLITHVQPEGRRIMTATEWAHGVHLKTGEKFI